MPVPVTDYISTTDPSDTFATHDSLLGKGGYREVSTLVERNNITTERQRIGMLCYVGETGKVYLLVEDTPSSVWIEFAGGGGGADLNYMFAQSTPSSTWIIQHNLGKHPSVTVVASDTSTVIGDIHYDDLYNLTLTFSAPFSGTAYLN